MRKRSLFRTSIALISCLTLFWQFCLPQPTAAATMTVLRMYLNRQQADVATGITFQLFLTPKTNVSGGANANELRIIFPDADDGKWCRSAGSLTVTGITDPTGGSESATQLPGTLAGSTCAAGSGSGSAESNRDRLLIAAVSNLTATTKYGVQIVANAGALGTASSAGNNIQVEVRTRDNSTQIDSGSLALSLITSDQVAVSATVTPTLTVVVAGAPVSLGVLASTSNSYAGITSTVTTNASGGYLSVVKYDATLTSGSDTIADVTGSPPDNLAAGTAAYGVSSSQTGNTVGQWDADSSNCDGTTRTTANTVSATSLSTTFKSFASSATPKSSEAATLCFLATMSGTTPAGSYTSTSTVVTTARF
jgi:hypothetical protein